MAKASHSRDVGFDCDAAVRAETEVEVLPRQPPLIGRFADAHAQLL